MRGCDSKSEALFSGHHPRAHRRGEERHCVRSMKARSSSLARDHAMPLPTMTSSNSGLET
jgi:hypothetical protein